MTSFESFFFISVTYSIVLLLCLFFLLLLMVFLRFVSCSNLSLHVLIVLYFHHSSLEIFRSFFLLVCLGLFCALRHKDIGMWRAYIICSLVYLIALWVILVTFFFHLAVIIFALLKSFYLFDPTKIIFRVLLICLDNF